MRTDGLLERLERHYIKPGEPLAGGVFLPEVGINGGGSSRCDAIYVGFTSTSGRMLVGHELKVSRADWRRELDQPGKAHGSTELPLDDQRDLFSLFNPGEAWEPDGSGGVRLAPNPDDAEEKEDPDDVVRIEGSPTFHDAHDLHQTTFADPVDPPAPPPGDHTVTAEQWDAAENGFYDADADGPAPVPPERSASVELEVESDAALKAAARKTEDDRIAAMQAKRTRRPTRDQSSQGMNTSSQARAPDSPSGPRSSTHALRGWVIAYG